MDTSGGNIRGSARGASPVGVRALSLALVTMLLLAAAAACSTQSERKWVMGYYVGYLADRYPIDSIAWDSLSHIAVGAALPREDGSLDTAFYMHEGEGPAWAKKVVQAAQQHNVEPILMIGGADTSAQFRDATRTERRERFVGDILSIVDEYGFAGVDLDWEPMTEHDVPIVKALAEDLRSRRPELVLTVPIGSVNINRAQDVPTSISTLAAAFDQVNLMTYGMHGAGWRDWHSWHPGALQGETTDTPMSIASTVDTYLQAGLPAHKLGLGIGFYGACYRGVTGPNQQSSSMRVVADDNKMSYANVMDDYYREDLVKWDQTTKTPYLTSTQPLGPLECTYIPFEDERSVALKAQYAVNQGLGGVIIWNINEGHRKSLPQDKRDELLRTISSELDDG